MPVKLGLANAVPKVCAVTTADVLVLELHRPRSPCVVGEEVLVAAASITAGLDASQWEIVTTDECTRTRTNREGRPVQSDDVVVRATRRS